ncbi:retrovirus-related pol polyprotein from transposon TNT 1-94 [Tanacetum coccineum]
MRELRSKIFAGAGLEVEKRLPTGVINTWDLLEKEFIWQYCSPFKTAKKLEEIRNFKQEIDDTLYHAWERYNDLLDRCPQHDLNCQQKKKINDSPDNVDAIQESVNEAYLTKECSLKKEDKAVEQREKFKTRTTMGKENMKESVSSDLPPTPFLEHLKEQIGSPYRTCETVCAIGIPEEIHKIKAREDKGDMKDGLDSTTKDVERLRKIPTPTIHNLKPVVQPYMPLGIIHAKEKAVKKEEHDYDIPLHDGMTQPLTHLTVHITPPEDDYVSSATNPILNKHLNKFQE